MKRIIWLVFLSTMISTPPGWSQTAPKAAGTIYGRIVDKQTQSPLPGAVILLEETKLTSTTNRAGEYRLEPVPSGQCILKASYLGYDSISETFNLKDGESLQVDVELSPMLKTTLDVSEPFQEGQAKALSDQMVSPNIKNVVAADQIGRFPDPNAAEAIQRIPGVTLERDQGEGRYIIIRGTEPRLTSTSINGQRIPSPDGDVRFVALDVVPTDLLEKIEVAKTLTPDMEGDAIGGAINLVTKGAPQGSHLSLTLGGGVNQVVNRPLATISGSYSTRFLENRLGMVTAVSFLSTDRGSQNYEPSYDEGYLAELELRDYSVNRKRMGFSTAWDYKASEASQLFVNYMFAKFDDQEYRRRYRYRIDKGTSERELKDRYESQIITSLSGGGTHRLPDFFNLDYSLAYSFARENEPDATYPIFQQKKLKYNPNVTPDSIDRENIQANPLNEDYKAFKLKEISLDHNYTSDNSFACAFNVSRPWNAPGNINSLIKFGGKFRMEDKNRDNHTTLYSPGKDYLLSNYLDPTFRVGEFLNEKYHPGSEFVGSAAGRSLLTQPDMTQEIDHEADAANYDAQEKIAAGYGMLNLNVGESFSLVPGIRYEHTTATYTGQQVLYDDNGDYLSTSPIRGSKNYGNALPSLNATYRLGSNTNLRGAVTRSLSRPNFADLVPYELVLKGDNEIQQGNPELNPTRSWNYDLLAEHYFKTVGVVSGGFFAKQITDNIFLYNQEIERDGYPYQLIQPLNGKKGTIRGLELAFQNQLKFLPGFLGGFGFYANYTYCDSSAVLPGERTSTLPGQARNVGNVALFYEKYGFSGRLSMNYRDKYLSEVSDSASEDLYFDSHSQWDLSVSQRINRNLRVYAEIINLSKEPFWAYRGAPNRAAQFEYYSWWGTLGVKLDF